MDEQQGRNNVPVWVLRSVLCLCVVATVPLYMVFLYSAAQHWALQLEPGDFTRQTLPFMIPCAAFGFTLIAALSWWMTLFFGRPVLIGRNSWWLVAFITAMSLTAAVLGVKGRVGVADVVLAAAIVASGMVGLWLLPPALSPRLLSGLPQRGRTTQPTP